MSETTVTTTDSTTTDPAPAAQTVESLPEWAQAKLKEARSEAAKYRTERNSAVEAAKAEVEQAWTAKLTEAEGKLAATETDLSKLKLALATSFDDEAVVTKLITFAGLIQGGTEDERKAHATTLKTLFSTPAAQTGPPAVNDPSQGQSNASALNSDGLLSAIQKAIVR